ncbi:AP2 domain-containing protein [Thermodesulfobacteriota bacterium]
MTNNKSKHKDIARVDQESKSTFGWYVRIRFLGKNYRKFFSDKKSGGKKNSLLAAIAWRDATEKKLGKPRTDRMIYNQTKSNTGVVGVRLNEQLNRYEVNWLSKEGKPGRTSRSINKYGKAEAFKLACEERAKMEAERLGST